MGRAESGAALSGGVMEDKEFVKQVELSLLRQMVKMLREKKRDRDGALVVMNVPVDDESLSFMLTEDVDRVVDWDPPC